MNDATTIGAEMVPTDAPPSVGGTIADGTYHLTNISVFTRAGGGSGSLPLSIQETIHIQGTNVEVIGNANGTLERVSETFVTNGDAVTFTQTCPSPGKPASIAHYSISGTTLTMFMVNDAGQTVSYAYTP